MMYCPQCGVQNPDGTQFCANCGYAFSNLHGTQSKQPVSSVDYQQAFQQFEKTKFFSFASPFIRSVENGNFFKKPFRWVYIAFAVLSLLTPLYILFTLIQNDVFSYGGIRVFIMWLFIAFAGWIGFQIWWDRKVKINMYLQKGDDFIATPIYSHFFQTLGEWYGAVVAILGFGTGLIILLFGGGRGYGYGEMPMPLPVPLLQSGGLLIFVGPIAGFFIVVIFRAIAELIRALAAIANNTRKTNT